MEQIEEWNEYGELKQQIESITHLDALPEPRVNTPANTSAKPPTPAESPAPAPATPKPTSSSPHIQIQTPPSKNDVKDDHIALALRQAGEEAASKAKENARAKLGTKPPSKEGDGKLPPTSKPEAKATEPVGKVDAKDVEGRQPGVPVSDADQGQHRQSVAPAPEIVAPPQRPSLESECAAVSSANFRAENAETLGLVGHHRGSIVSATSKEEKDQVARDLRDSVSQPVADGDLQELRSSANKGQEETVEDEEEEEGEGKADEEKKDTDGHKVSGEETSPSPQQQDPKAGEQAGISVKD